MHFIYKPSYAAAQQLQLTAALSTPGRSLGNTSISRFALFDHSWDNTCTATVDSPASEILSQQPQHRCCWQLHRVVSHLYNLCGCWQLHGVVGHQCHCSCGHSLFLVRQCRRRHCTLQRPCRMRPPQFFSSVCQKDSHNVSAASALLSQQ